MEVECGRVERLVIATGTIEPATEVELRPRISGIVQKIHVGDGDRIGTGTMLVELERDLLASQVREAQAALQEANVEVRFSRIALGQEEQLQANDVTSDRKLNDARARTERAEALRLRAEAGLDSLATRLGYASVTSSLLGRVLKVHVEEGDAVSSVTSVSGGTLLLSLAGDDVLHLKGLVDENEVARVSLGQLARVQTEAYKQRIFQGVVREIAPLGQRIQNVTYFEVKIEITDPDAGLLRPRMSGDAEIVTQVIEDAITVPETALHYLGDEIFVELVSEPLADSEGFEIEKRYVEIGIVDGARVQILAGLEAGERVRLQ